MAMCGEAAQRTATGEVTGSLANAQVMSHWGLLCCEAEALLRRLGWYQKISWDPANNRQLLAALFGVVRMDADQPELASITTEYRVGPGALPWTKQFFADMEHLTITTAGLELQLIVGNAWALVFNEGEAAEAFARIDISEIRALFHTSMCPFQISEKTHVQAGQFSLVCGIEGCGAAFSTRQKLLTHMRTSHDFVSVIGQCVVSNMCPCCPAILASQKGAVKHLVKS